MAARTLGSAGAAWFAVSSLAEARHLRRSGISQPILILGMTRPECAGTLAAEHITQAVYSLEYAQALLPVALEAAKGMWRGPRVDTLELELTAGGSDPADAAMLYGQANAALGALWRPLTKAFHVKDGTARVRLDFDAPGTTVYGQASLSIKIGTVTRIGLRAGVKALFGALAARKRLKTKQRKAA